MISDSGRSKRAARVEFSLSAWPKCRLPKACLRIHPRLCLELRHGQRAVDQDERGDRERDEPGVDLPERRDPDAERGEHEVSREALDRKKARLADPVTAASASIGASSVWLIPTRSTHAVSPASAN